MGHVVSDPVYIAASQGMRLKLTDTVSAHEYANVDNKNHGSTMMPRNRIYRRPAACRGRTRAFLGQRATAGGRPQGSNGEITRVKCGPLVVLPLSLSVRTLRPTLAAPDPDLTLSNMYTDKTAQG